MSRELSRLTELATADKTPGPARRVLVEEPSASIAHARVCEGRGRPRYGDPYSGTKPETADTGQRGAYGWDSSSPTRKQITTFPIFSLVAPCQAGASTPRMAHLFPDES
jgi:hypothetical protein